MTVINDEKKMQFRRADICLLIILCIVAMGLFIVHRAYRKEGSALVISWDGAEVARVPLKAGEKDGTGAVSGTAGSRYCQMLYAEDGISLRWYEEGEPVPKIPAGMSYNTLKISETEVLMEAADCRDQICVHHIPIAGGGESIICLPHRLVVEIVGEKDVETPDAVAWTDNISGIAWKEGWRSHETDG